MALHAVPTSASFRPIALKLEWGWSLFDARHFNEACAAHAHLEDELQVAARACPAGICKHFSFGYSCINLIFFFFYGRGKSGIQKEELSGLPRAASNSDSLKRLSFTEGVRI